MSNFSICCKAYELKDKLARILLEMKKEPCRADYKKFNLCKEIYKK